MKSILRKLGIVTVILTIAIISAYLYAPTWIRHKIKEKADAYGIQVDVNKIELHLDRIVLSDIPVSSPYFPNQKLSISTVTIHFGLSGIRQVIISGGDLKIIGIFSEIKKQFSEWKNRSTTTNTPKQGSGPKLNVKFDSIKATWQSPHNNISQITINGINNLKSDIGTTEVTIDTTAGSTFVKHIEYENESKTIYIDEIKSEVNSLELIKNLESTQLQTRSTIEDEKVVSSYKININDGVLKILNHEVIASNVELNTHPLLIQAREAKIDDKIRMIQPSVDIQKTPQGWISNITIGSLTTSNPTITNEIIVTKPIALHVQILGKHAKIEANIHTTKFKMDLHKNEDEIRFILSMNDTPCQDVLDSIPQGVKSIIDGMELQGNLAWELHGEIHQLSKTEPSIELKLNNTCKITKIPDDLSVKLLRKPFKRTVLDQTGSPFEITNGPNTEGWTTVGLTSQFIPLAFRTMEDPGFLAHRGFDIQAIENSIKENIKSKKFLRGASTITMQLAKNLWLNRSKTFARKIQEAFLTMYLEQALTKDEILELYMNVVEFGPKIYGIGKASAHYFNKHPANLTLGQSLFLASILPNPKISFFDSNGNLNQKRAGYLKLVMKAMLDRKWISQDEYNEGIKEVLKFKQASVDGEEQIELPQTEPWQVLSTQ